MGETCEWQEDAYTTSWDTECGNKFQFFDDGPVENGFLFCPYCGKQIHEVRIE